MVNALCSAELIHTIALTRTTSFTLCYIARLLLLLMDLHRNHAKADHQLNRYVLYEQLFHHQSVLLQVHVFNYFIFFKHIVSASCNYICFSRTGAPAELQQITTDQGQPHSQVYTEYFLWFVLSLFLWPFVMILYRLRLCAHPTSLQTWSIGWVCQDY